MDIDIDFQTTFDVTKIITTAVPASMVQNGKLVRHNCGAYLQSIPVDQHTGLSAIPYEEADQYGFFKIDFLHLSVLDQFKDRQTMVQAAHTDPDWDLMLNPEVVGQLFQLRNHFDVVSQVKPHSIQELADCIALIRPGKKRLLTAYLRSPDAIRAHVYRTSSDDKSAFRRSHAIAYALTIVLQLHLLADKYPVNKRK